MAEHVTALFYDPNAAADAVDALMKAGVEKDEISLFARDEVMGRHFGVEPNSKGPEGVATGGAIGGAIGAIAVGAATVATGGAGILAAGPILLALGGLGAGAAVGGLVGGLIGVGIPEYEAKYYDEEIREKDAILLGVTTDDHDTGRIKAIIDKFDTASLDARS